MSSSRRGALWRSARASASHARRTLAGSRPATTISHAPSHPTSSASSPPGSETTASSPLSVRHDSSTRPKRSRSPERLVLALDLGAAHVAQPVALDGGQEDAARTGR